MIPLQSNPLFRHLFPFSSPCNDPFWWITPHLNQSFNSWVKQFSSTLYSLSLFYPHHQIPTTWSRICDHWIITYLAMGKPQITPNYCYSSKQILITSLNEDIKKSWIWLIDYTICGKWNATLSIWGCAEYKPNQCKIWDIDRRLVKMKRLFMIIP